MFLFSVEDCRGTLVQFGVQDITPAAVARVLGKKSTYEFSFFLLFGLPYISLDGSSENNIPH